MSDKIIPIQQKTKIRIMKLEQLKQEERELNQKLSENLKKQKQILTDEFIQKHGANIGDLVEWGKGQKGVISRIDYTGRTPYHYMVYLFNKDEKVGKREIRLYSRDLETLKVIKKAEN
jgi:hypothetical protein